MRKKLASPTRGKKSYFRDIMEPFLFHTWFTAFALSIAALLTIVLYFVSALFAPG
jgi:hypothetical protein